MSSRRTALRMRAAVLALVTCSSVQARAQSAADGWAPPPSGPRPTSGEASFLGGRTLGVGQTFVAAAIGWPGAWAHLELAPDSIVNLGVRAGVVYGSPVMGLVSGAGAEVVAAVRIHVFGERDVDLALRIAPVGALGEGRLFGEQASEIRASDLGIGARLDVGLLLGWRIVEHLTLVGTASAGAGSSWVGSERVRPIGLFTAGVGLEALLGRQTMLFGALEGGVGVADGSGRAVPYYPQQEILRLWLGLGTLL